MKASDRLSSRTVQLLPINSEQQQHDAATTLLHSGDGAQSYFSAAHGVLRSGQKFHFGLFEQVLPHFLNFISDLSSAFLDLHDAV